jgi:hypothetical protein
MLKMVPQEPILCCKDQELSKVPRRNAGDEQRLSNPTVDDKAVAALKETKVALH